MTNNLLYAKAFVIALLLLSTAFHEMGHAFVATWFGDPTPGRNGRLTLNPIPHLQPVMTAIVLPILMFMTAGGLFILASTPVDPSRMRHPLRDQALMALAGPFMNIVCAVVLVGVLWIPGVTNVHGPETITVVALRYSIFMNLILAAFNMIPIPPLDGYRILRPFLPLGARRLYDDFARNQYSWIIAIVVASALIPYVDEPFWWLVRRVVPGG